MNRVVFLEGMCINVTGGCNQVSIQTKPAIIHLQIFHKNIFWSNIHNLINIHFKLMVQGCFYLKDIPKNPSQNQWFESIAIIAIRRYGFL